MKILMGALCAILLAAVLPLPRTAVLAADLHEQVAKIAAAVSIGRGDDHRQSHIAARRTVLPDRSWRRLRIGIADKRTGDPSCGPPGDRAERGLEVLHRRDPQADPDETSSR